MVHQTTGTQQDRISRSKGADIPRRRIRPLLGAGLTFSPPLYAPYIAAPRVWGISAATDQQLGGLIMWVPVSISYIVVMSVLFIRWMQQQEAKQLAEEREAYEKQVAEDKALTS